MNLFMNDQVKDRLDKFYDLPVEIQNKIFNDLDPTKIIMAISVPDNLTQMVRGLPVINLTRPLFGFTYAEEFEIVPRARGSKKDVLPYKQVYIDYYYCLALLYIHTLRSNQMDGITFNERILKNKEEYDLLKEVLK